MPRYHPTVSKRARASYTVQLLVLACLSGALIALVSVLASSDATSVLDPNGNPAVPKTYGFAAGRP